MVYWHTCWKRFHTYLNRKWRPWNFTVLFGTFYAVYWYNRSGAYRAFVHNDLNPMTRSRATEEKRDFGYRKHYEPKIARSRKNMLIAQGGYEPRLPFEDLLKADEALLPHQRA
jgi:hypothetical protein